MKITEKMLLDGYNGLTNGMDHISIINGKTIYWNYREGQTPDGFNCVNDNHPASAKIYEDKQKISGVHI
jgi:hypothetical protein